MLNPQLADLIRKLQKSPTFFITNFCHVKHPSAGIIPFDLFSYQRKCIRHFMDNRFIIFKKTRQCGISTLTGAYALWMAMFHNNKTILVVSKRDKDAMHFLLRNIRFPYTYLPSWMRDLWPLTKDNDHEIGFANGSTITSLTSSPDTLRSHASSLNILDEAAFMPHMDEMWAAGLPTLTHGGSVIVISTVNGQGNWYWKTWTDADRKKNDFRAVLIDWWDMDWSLTYKEPITSKEVTIAPCNGIVKLNDPESIKKYGPYWSPWLEQQYRNLTQRGDSSKFRQEVLCEFIGIGNNVIPKETLDIVASTIDEQNIRTLSIVDYINPTTGERVNIDFQNQLYIWEDPVVDKDNPSKSHMYVLGADVSSGEAEDFSGIQVFNIVTRTQVAELQIRTQPKIFARMVDYIGRLYNNALAVVERTGMGSPVIQELNEQLCYPNLYRDVKEKANLQKKYSYYGFNTQRGTKPVLDKALLDYLGSNGYTIKSMRLLQELRIYVYLNNGKTGCEPSTGNHDDLVLSAALGLHGIDTVYTNTRSTLIPLTASFQQIQDNYKNKITDFMTRGGRNVLLPFSVPMDPDKNKTIQQQIDAFANSMGGIPLDKSGRPVGMPVTTPRKHVIDIRPPHAE